MKDKSCNAFVYIYFLWCHKELTKKLMIVSIIDMIRL